MKIKETNYGEVMSKFRGLKRLKYEDVETYKYIQHGGILGLEVEVMRAYNPRKDCTYMIFSPIGYVDLGVGVDKDARTLILRYDGHINTETYNTDYKEDLQMIYEDLTQWYRNK